MTRWSWYLLVSMVAVISAESLSGSTPFIFPLGIFALITYGLHYVLILDFLVGRQAITLRTLAIGGVVIGITTESLMTKVIWNPPWPGEDPLRILGLGVYEVGFIVGVWHAWMSMALPIALTMTLFGQSAILSPQQVRRILRLLPVTLFYIAALNGFNPLMAIPIVGLNGIGILLTAAWFLRQNKRRPLESIRLTRIERRILWGLLILLYVLVLPYRSEAIPTLIPLLLGILLIAASLLLLERVSRTAQTPPPQPMQYTHKALIHYLLYFMVTGLILMTLGTFGQSITTLIALMASLLLTLWGIYYLWRSYHEST